MHKYLVLDFGGVIAGPKTGDWDMTPKFLELIDINSVNKDEYKKAREKYSHILSEKIMTLEEEYDMFFRFYDGILKEINYKNYNKKLSQLIAYDRTYKNDKYILYDNIINELKSLKEKYTLIMLSDNWPCAINYLHDYKLDIYFDKVYISSFYGVEKKDKVFFDIVINEYNIKEGQAIFIDDNESNLDIAYSKGFDVYLMDRFHKVKKSKYKIINNLSNI